jgi:hypothetical protein
MGPAVRLPQFFDKRLFLISNYPTKGLGGYLF